MFVSQAAIREWNARKEEQLAWKAFNPHDLLAFHALSKPFNAAATAAVTGSKKDDNGNGTGNGDGDWKAENGGKKKGWLNFTDVWDGGRFWPGGNN